ncbi:MAG TPA: mannonate dehydratase [Gaiellaceae bacterium]|nr:mannonate dehydratase [Gaiellaceae bacterium]
MKLSEMLAARPQQPLWALLKQCGVDHVVAVMRNGEQDRRMFAAVGGGGSPTDGDAVPWSQAAIERDVATFAEHGFTVVAIEDTPPLDEARLGLPGRDEQIENVQEQIRAMGKLGIPVLCYNWMAVSSWTRTDHAAESRAGALVTGFREADAKAMPLLVQPGELTAEQLWDSFAYFLQAVVPVAEEAGVRLALHPDDPPLPVVRGVPRIMSSVEAFRRVLDLFPSPANGVTLCQGNFALMTDDLPTLIRELGARDAIHFVHFRDVRGDAHEFLETFHDDGQSDLAACMRAYAEVGFDGPLRPDHVPTMYGESNDHPGYETLGRLFANGYVRGLMHATAGRTESA